MAAEKASKGWLAQLSEEMAGAVERAGQAVVAVDARRRLPASGIVWPGSGVVVTADHVLERDEDITVTLAGGQKLAATLAGRDPGSDVAVLRLNGAAPGPAELAPEGSVKVGHFALALGRPGTDLPVVSFGVISTLGGAWRTARGGAIEGYIRADLVLYPGFSGGPLVDIQGRVVGLNSSHLAHGLGLAIPAHAVSGIVETLQTQGRIRRAYLGLTSQPVVLPEALRRKLGLKQETGLIVVGTEPGSPADKGGLLMGDVLVDLGGYPINDGEDLQAVLSAQEVGKSITLSVVRGGEARDLTVTPGERK
ncbi:MAG: trypsin-like peptidase domain-containing protein [Dehalococcoidia bacterium]|nr:trypsin-like peptidase domain-containing protein [Dehalococcoidia bacterium]